MPFEFHHLPKACCIVTPRILIVQNELLSASQCLWHEWMNAPFPARLYVALRCMAALKSRMYWFKTLTCAALHFSGSVEQASQFFVTPHSPLSVEFCLGKPGGSAAVKTKRHARSGGMR